MATVTLIWKGGGVLAEGGKRVPDGGEFTVSAERAAELLRRPDVVEAHAAVDLPRLTRSELDQIAAEAGVEAPESLPNKDAVIAAIQESEAREGDGQQEEPVTGSAENPDEKED